MFLVPYVLMLLAGASEAAFRGLIKLTNIHTFVLLAGGYGLALPAYAIWLVIEGMPDVTGMFWVAITFQVPLQMFSNVLLVRAHRKSPLILTTPYLALTPAFLLIVSPFMGGGTPTLLGGCGVLVLTIGVYVLNFAQAKKTAVAENKQFGILDPFRALKREEGSRLMLLVAAIFAIASNLDYVAMKNSSAPFYLLVDHGLNAVGMILVALAYVKWSTVGNSIEFPRGKTWGYLAGFGGTLAFSVIVHMIGLRLLENVSYAIVTKRSGGIICAILLGFVLSRGKARKGFERERENLATRLVGIASMLIGMTIILLWGKE